MIKAAATLAVLAARRPRRVGDLIWPKQWWNDDLEWGLGWAIYAQTGIATCAQNAPAKHAGSYGLLLRTRVATPAAGDWVAVDQYATAPTQDYLTLATWLRLPIKARAAILELQLRINDGASAYGAHLWHDIATNKWRYWTSGGAAADVPGGAYVFPDNTWIPITLRLRRSTHKWVKITWPGGSADMSALSLYPEGAAMATPTRFIADVVTSGALTVDAHLDDFQLFHSPNP